MKQNARSQNIENAAQALERAAAKEHLAAQQVRTSIERTNYLLEAVSEKLTALGHILLCIERSTPGD